jgi:hypothetical protein
MCNLYEQRIPITEFMALFSADDDWSHMATKQQSERVFELFDKAYGYVKGLSRLEEQQKRYQKRVEARAQPTCKLQHQHTAECQAKAAADAKAEQEAGGKNKGVINELFDVGAFLADKNMVERYSSHLNKVLINAHDSHIQARHRQWLSQGKEEVKQLSFYERMKIDEMMRDSKAAAAEAEQAQMEGAGPEDEDSDEDSDEDGALAEQAPEERERHRRIKRLAASLKIPYDKAAVIDQMTASKGI